MNDNKFPQMDWQQVALNGGPPCFHVEGPQFCGRAERWHGHGNPAFHDFVSLQQYVTKAIADERARCMRIAEQAFEPAHTYASENSSAYRTFDAGQRQVIDRIIATIRRDS